MKEICINISPMAAGKMPVVSKWLYLIGFCAVLKPWTCSFSSFYVYVDTPIWVSHIYVYNQCLITHDYEALIYIPVNTSLAHFKWHFWTLRHPWTPDCWLGVIIESRSVANIDKDTEDSTLWLKCLHIWGRDKWTPFRRRHFQMHFLEW